MEAHEPKAEDLAVAREEVGHQEELEHHDQDGEDELAECSLGVQYVP